MSFVAWLVLGLIAGFVGSQIINKTGEVLVRDIVLGAVGAVLGGWLFNNYWMPGVTGLNLYSLAVAVMGAAGFLTIYHLFFRPAS
jgi:uncharacterized membrane protein YeaQ/YmgE (transglycosylase-associated protein family)